MSIKDLPYTTVEQVLRLREAAIKLEEQREWISVEARLPDEGEVFLAYVAISDCHYVCTMRLPVLLDKNARPTNDKYSVDRVTHWMPIPPLPQK